MNKICMFSPRGVKRQRRLLTGQVGFKSFEKRAAKKQLEGAAEAVYREIKTDYE